MSAVVYRSLLRAFVLSARTSLARLGVFAASRLGMASAAQPSAETARVRLSDIVGLGTAADVIAIAGSARSDASIETNSPTLVERNIGGETFHRLVAETMSDVVIVRRPHQAPNHVSPSLKRMLGLDPAEFRLRDRIHPQDLAVLDALDATIGPSKPSAVLTIRMRHADGRWIWVEAVNDYLEMTEAPAIDPPE